MKSYIAVILLVFSIGFASAQTASVCTEVLKEAERKFDEGKLDEIPQMLQSCLQDGFTKEEKVRAYKLLIQTYLFSERLQQADEVMMRFLNEFPSYSIAVNDPKEFVNLYRTYRTNPIFKVELSAGVTFCKPSVVEQYGVGDINTIESTYKPKMGYGVALNYINSLYRDFDYSIGVSLTVQNFDYSNTPTSYSSVTGSFSSTYIGLPLAVRYNYNLRGITIFAKAGVEPVYLAKSTVELTRLDKIIGRQEPFSGTEDLLSSSNRFDVRPFVGLGASFKLWDGWFNVAGGYKLSTMVQANNDKRYSNQTLFSKYYFVLDDLRLNQYYISVSYIRPIYNPKKIK
ncbi:MAG: outer membrane beta-barrel protein [Bacteroidales bacterium]|nr:outer membrane beta-barrel protein [Bacteroidales bacterium]